MVIVFPVSLFQVVGSSVLGSGLGSGSVGVGAEALAPAAVLGSGAVARVEEQSGDEEPSMKDLMKEMRKMSFSLGGKFDVLSNQYRDLRAELQKLKIDMVTKQAFASLPVLGLGLR